MAIELVSHASAVGQFGISGQASMNTTGADFLVAVLACFDKGATPISDSKGNTWTAAATGIGDDPNVTVYYCIPASVGSGHTFSSTGSFAAISVAAFSGVAQSSPVDETTSASNSTQPGSLTPLDDGSLWITAFGGNFLASAPVANAPFTTESIKDHTSGDTYASGLAWDIQTTATARNPTWSPSAGVVWGIVFKEAVASEVTGSGDLVAGDASVSGAGASASSGSGVLVSGSAVVDGAGTSASSGIGALAAGDASASGAGTVSDADVTGSGVLVAGDAAVEGSGTSSSGGAGELTAQSASIAGAGTSASSGSGDLAADAAALDGAGASESAGSGVLVSGPAHVLGSGAGLITGSGELVAGADATMSGAGSSGSAGTGAMLAGRASIVGSGASGSSGSGALVAANDNRIDGVGSSGSTGSGDLVAGDATMHGGDIAHLAPSRRTIGMGSRVKVIGIGPRPRVISA